MFFPEPGIGKERLLPVMVPGTASFNGSGKAPSRE
jgi:hypothetical protein